MNLQLQIIDPLNHPQWDEWVLSSPNYSFFHSSTWARVLYDTYNYKARYFASSNNGHLAVLIPIMEVNSYLTGRRGVSLPFSDYCEPIVFEKECFRNALRSITDFGKGAGWRYVELRGGKSFFKEIQPSSSYNTHTLHLTQNEEKIFSKFRSSTKRNVKKAVRLGVEVEICHSLGSINEFFRLYCKTRKCHGLPPQPYSFFKKIYEHIISKDKGFVTLASYEKKKIAGAVFFHFGREANFKYGASDRRYLSLRPNNWK